jgi:WD40 repeat protein
VALSADGSLVLSGSHDNTVRVWATSTGECVRILSGHKAPVNALALSADGVWALSGSGLGTDPKSEKTMKLWHVGSGRCERTFREQRGMVKAVAVGPNGGLAISGNGSLLDEIVKGVLFEASPTGELIHSRSARDNDVALYFWNVKTGKCVRSNAEHRLAIQSVAIGQDGRLAVSGSLDRTVRLWDVMSGSCVDTVSVEAWTHCVAIDVNSRSVFFKNTDSSVGRYDIDKRTIVRTYDGQGHDANAIAVSVCGGVMLTGSSDKRIRVWDVRTGKSLIALEGQTEQVNSVALDGSGAIAASGSDDGTVCLWRLDWDYEFPGWADWDERARPFVETFLRAQVADGTAGPLRRVIQRLVPLRTRPIGDAAQLLDTLSYAGLGWIRADGVRRQLGIDRVHC